MRGLYVNLPVKDVEASKRFFTALGFSFNAQFSNDETACMVVEENISVLMHAEPRFRDFITGGIGDPAQGVEVLNCLSASSREEVDQILAKALAAGGKPWKPNMDYGFMYGCSFQDLDGHVWELAYMDMAAMQAAA